MSYQISIQSEDIPKQLDKLLKMEVDQEREYKAIISTLLKSGKLEITSEIPVFTGGAKKSVRTRMKGFGPNITGRIGSGGRSGWWINIIEYGRRSKKAPPTARLLSWVEQTLGVSATEAPGVAWAVGRSIARKGIPAVKMFERTKEHLMSRATPMMAEANQRIVNGMVVK